jgi:hypothetical protein
MLQSPAAIRFVKTRCACSIFEFSQAWRSANAVVPLLMSAALA